MPDQQIAVDAAQIETLAARQDSDRHLADFGGREHEFGVRWRLFQRLQQRIEGLRREHMHFIEDIDFVARRYRRITHRIVDLAHIVDAESHADAASISMTSMCRLSMIAWQCSPITGMSMLGPFTEPSGNW